MKNLIFVFALTIIFVVPLKSQDKNISSSTDEEYSIHDAEDILVDYHFKIYKIIDQKIIDGSPYVFDEFKAGVIFSKKEKAAFNLDLNVNAISHLFEFMYKDEIYEMPNFAFDSVLINDQKFIPVSIVEDDKVSIFPMEVLLSDSNGNYLLKKNIVKFMDRTEVKPFIEANPAHYKKFPHLYFLYCNNKDLIALNNLKKLDQIDGMPDDLNSFVRKNKISRRNENDLKLLFTFIYVGDCAVLP